MSVPFPNPVEKEFLEEHKRGIDNGTPEEVLNIIQSSFSDSKDIGRIYLVYALFADKRVLVRVWKKTIDFSLDSQFPELDTFYTLNRSFIRGDKSDVWNELISEEFLGLTEDLAKPIYERILIWE